jgi:hypothetical protein
MAQKNVQPLIKNVKMRKEKPPILALILPLRRPGANRLLPRLDPRPNLRQRTDPQHPQIKLRLAHKHRLKHSPLVTRLQTLPHNRPPNPSLHSPDPFQNPARKLQPHKTRTHRSNAIQHCQGIGSLLVGLKD